MPTDGEKTKALLEMARRGPVRARDLDILGVPRAYLQRLCERGVLDQIDRGLYRIADAPVTELHALSLVAKRVPHATVCLLSALQYHELTTELPNAVWIMIDRTARMPKLRYPRVEVVRASGAARTFGIEHHRIEGIEMPLTTPAKTVADCFRYRRYVGLDVALEALRDYLAKNSKRSRPRNRVVPDLGEENSEPSIYSIDALVEAARVDRIYTIMRPYMEALT